MGGFVAFLLIMLVVAAALRIDFFFTIVYLFAGIYLLSRFWVQAIKKNLRVSRAFADHVFSGETVTLDLTVANTGWLPIPWLLVTETLPAELTPPVPPELLRLRGHEERHIPYTFACRRRGYYPLGPLKLSTGDLLGVMPRIGRRLERQYLTVYPRIVPLQRLGLPTRSPLAVLPSRSPLFEDTSRVMGVRPYLPGDSPRRIHWTATASAGELLVKRYQPAVARETMICLDLDSDHYTQRYTSTELAIVTAASLAYHIIVQEGLPAGLATGGVDPAFGWKRQFYLPPRPERAHLIQLLEVLARVQTAPDIPLSGLFHRDRGRLEWGATMVIITGRESQELYDTLVGLQRAGFALALILVQAGRALDTRGLAAPRGVTIYRVWNEHDVEIAL